MLREGLPGSVHHTRGRDYRFEPGRPGGLTVQQLDHTPDTSQAVPPGLRRRASRQRRGRRRHASTRSRWKPGDHGYFGGRAISRRRLRAARPWRSIRLRCGSPDRCPSVAADDSPGKAQTHAVTRTPWAAAFSSRLREARRKATGRRATAPDRSRARQVRGRVPGCRRSRCRLTHWDRRSVALPAACPRG